MYNLFMILAYFSLALGVIGGLFDSTTPLPALLMAIFFAIVTKDFKNDK